MDAFIGEIRMFPFTFTPQGWLRCNAALYNAQEYQALYALIGNHFGGSAQQGTFAVPDLRDQLVVCQGQGPGLSSYTWGQRFGVDQVTLGGSQAPPHSHTVTARVGSAGVTGMTGVAGVVSGVGTSLLSRSITTGAAVTRSYDQAPAQQTTNLGMELSPAYGNLPGGGATAHDNRMPYLGMGFFICADGGTWPEHP